MAAEILKFSTGKDQPVTHTGMTIASELLEALGELAVAQERGGSRESLDRLGKNAANAFRRMHDATDFDSAA
jgi:hypothetical protein